MTALFACTRAIHMGSCLLAMAVFFFDRFVARPHDRHWPGIARGLLMFALPVALLSGAVWFTCVAITMSGLPPGEALQWENLTMVWRETQFGHLWEVRAILYLGCAVISPIAIALRPGSTMRVGLSWLGLIVNASLVASLAWAGHGRFGESGSHLACDALHLLISAVWPVGLLPYAMLLAKFRADDADQKWISAWRLTRRVSAVSLVSVILLTATGILNSWPLVGSFSALFSTRYGQVLLLKIAIFFSMIALGGVNLLYLMPHMPHGGATDHGPLPRRMLSWLQLNVGAEIVLGIAVMLAVGLLGMLMPAVEHLLMHHHH
jgi:putative copper resistance protein D